jgi:hypothetical protein
METPCQTLLWILCVPAAKITRTFVPENRLKALNGHPRFDILQSTEDAA